MNESDTQSSTRADTKAPLWNWHPPLPLAGIPVFVWPPKPIAALKYLVSMAFAGSVLGPFALTATLAWMYLQPPLEQFLTPNISVIVSVYLRNLLIMMLFAGGLHLYFYTFGRQGLNRKYDPRDLNYNHRKFFARNQVWDNMLWTCVSGVSFWTAYEILYFWAAANNLLPFYLNWRDHPLWFVIVFLAIPFWTSLHFYVVHRLLHIKWIYRAVHCVHHRNDNLGPWSGLSMHPIEHLIYLSSVLIHFFITSHPLHILFHMHWNTLGAVTTHTGFDAVALKGKSILFLGSFHHQLHHRFYDCNYGNQFIPCDRWFGSNHDGSANFLEQRSKEVTHKTT